MAQPFGKTKLKVILKELDCQSEYEAWQKSQPLDDEGAVRLDSLADEYEGIPRLRELEGYLLLDAGDDETIVVFRDNRGTRRELLGQLAPVVDGSSEMTPQTNALIDRQDRIQDYEDSEPEYKEISAIEWTSDEYVDDDYTPDEEPDYEIHESMGRPRAGKGYRST